MMIEEQILNYFGIQQKSVKTGNFKNSFCKHNLSFEKREETYQLAFVFFDDCTCWFNPSGTLSKTVAKYQRLAYFEKQNLTRK